MSSWIDFKELRAQLDFEKVLQRYGVEIKAKDRQHTGYCPLPSHDGKRRSPSFSAQLDRGIFHCFGCGAKGNALDFAVLMAGGNPRDGRALKKAALELQAKFCGNGDSSRSRKPQARGEPDAEPDQLELGGLVNEPLDFELKGLDPSHPYLAGRRFSKGTVAHFGLGFCERGYFAGRIAIPLHDSAGRLVGYAGRIVDDDAINDENPRYLLPSKRERDGVTLEFRKSLLLYNAHRIKKPQANLGVVEGFPSVWWMHQHGFPCVVSTMGSECSKEQAELIVSLVRPGGHVWIVPDADKAGTKFAHSLLPLLSPHRFVRWVKLEDGSQPTDMTPEKMKTCFTT